MAEFATELYQDKARIRERIADQTMHWWTKQGVITHVHDHFKVKEKLIRCLEDIGAP